MIWKPNDILVSVSCNPSIYSNGKGWSCSIHYNYSNLQTCSICTSTITFMLYMLSAIRDTARGDNSRLRSCSSSHIELRQLILWEGWSRGQRGAKLGQINLCVCRSRSLLPLGFGVLKQALGNGRMGQSKLYSHDRIVLTANCGRRGRDSHRAAQSLSCPKSMHIPFYCFRPASYKHFQSSKAIEQAGWEWMIDWQVCE